MGEKRRTGRKASSPGRKKASFEKKYRLDKRKVWLLLAGVAVCVIAIIAISLPKNKAKETELAPSLPVVVSSQPASAPQASLALSVQQSSPQEDTPSVPPSSAATAPPVMPEAAFSQEELARLDGMLAEWAEQAEEGEEDGHNVSVYFLDINSGLSYVYNAEKKFEIASIVKAPYAMYLYQLAEKGLCDLEEKFHITKEFAEESAENSGKIKDDPELPRDYTLNELLFYMLRYSDTAAQRAIMKKYPAPGYAAYAAGLGLHWPEDVRGITSGKITALDAGVYLKALYGYMEYGQFGSQLKEHLLNTRNRMITSQYPIARKYGWDGNAYHDIAVVYAPHPYLLAILTDKSAGTYTETATFGKISKTIEEIMIPKWNEMDEFLNS